MQYSVDCDMMMLEVQDLFSQETDMYIDLIIARKQTVFLPKDPKNLTICICKYAKVQSVLMHV